MQSPKEEEERKIIGGDEKAPAKDAASRYAALRNHSIRFEDAIDPNAARVDKLGKMDVVFGRGKGYQNHPGNKRMRSIIDRYKIKYHTLKRAEKKHLVEKVYNEIIEGGVRFVKKVSDEDSWILVDEPIAMQKVSHTLRCRKLKGADEADPATASSTGGAQRYNVAMHPQTGQPSSLMMQRGGILPSMQGSNPSLASLYGNLSGQPSAALGSMGSLGAMGAGSSLASLQAQSLSALGGYGGLGNLSMGAPPGMDYYTLLRRQQLETLMMQQDMARLNSARLHLATSGGMEGSAVEQYAKQLSKNNGGENFAQDGSTSRNTN